MSASDRGRWKLAGYGAGVALLAVMVLMAVRLGLVTAPSTGAILAVLPLGKAGAGPAVNDVARELGETFGVAVVGAGRPARPFTG